VEEFNPLDYIILRTVRRSIRSAGTVFRACYYYNYVLFCLNVDFGVLTRFGKSSVGNELLSPPGGLSTI
jgi:hypothetical protein